MVGGAGAWGRYLGRSSEVDNTVQLNVLAKLAVQPAVPVLVHGPFCVVHALVLIEVSREDVPEKQVESRNNKGEKDQHSFL